MLQVDEYGFYHSRQTAMATPMALCLIMASRTPFSMAAVTRLLF